MKLSLVIPTFNRSALLPTTLPALLGQETTDEFTYEIIFISNGSTDETVDILAEVAREHPGRLRYKHIAPTGGPSAPRNVGIREAEGDILIILDDDVLPDRDLVRRYAEFHRRHPQPNHAALGEAYVPERLLSDPMSMFHAFPYDEVRGLDRLDYVHFWTCNVSLKRSFMMQCGMFDETLLWYEDIVCGHRLVADGMHLHFLPEARGQHLHRREPSSVAAVGLMYGRWLYRFVQRLPERLIKERYGILSADIGRALLAKRLLRRAAFRAVDNPATRGILRALGATNGTRSSLSDFYYFLIFRRNLLVGYSEAKRGLWPGA